jgi:cytochrome b561
VPALPVDAPRWEHAAAHAGHWGLYVLMLASAASGWALAGTFRRPLDSFFGWFRVPPLVFCNGNHVKFMAVYTSWGKFHGQPFEADRVGGIRPS